MTQSSSRNPQNVPEDGPTRDLKLVLRGLHYDLDTELESFRKWRQQNQKPSNPQTPGLVSVPKKASRRSLFPNMPDLTPLTLGAGALILLSLGSILWFFTNRGQGPTATSSTPAQVQPAIPADSGNNLQSGTQTPQKSVEPQPSQATQVQPPNAKVAPLVPKPAAPVSAKKSIKADKPSPFSAFKGYGYYYVFVPVEGAKNLSRLKTMAPGVYPRVIEGQSYMQVAAYDSDRRAQAMAKQLRQSGYTVFVVK